MQGVSYDNAEVIAWDGNKRYLISLDGDLKTVLEAIEKRDQLGRDGHWEVLKSMRKPLGQVLDIEARGLSGAFSLNAILGHEDWYPCTVSPDQLDEWLKGVDTKGEPVPVARR